MGKKTKSPSVKKQEQSLDAAVVEKVTEIKNEANKLFAKKEYIKAIEQYDGAAKMLPETSTERADLLCNKAACYYQMKRFKDAVKECTNALSLAPSSNKALVRRAYSYEKQGLYKQALADLQAVNRSEAGNDDTRAAEQRLKDVVAGRRPASGTLATTNGTRAAATGAPARQPRTANNMYFNAKVQLGDEVRLLHLHANTSYAQLGDMVRAKFPEAPENFVVKCADKEGDLVTITSRQDLQTHMAEAVGSLERKGGLGPLNMPTVRLVVAPVATAAEVPQPPAEELFEKQALLQQRAAQLKAAAEAAAQQQAQQQQQQQPGEVMEMDEWLMDFAALFRDITNVDPDRHIEFHNEGWEACTRAMEATVRSDDAMPLFEKAIDRFKDVAVSGLLNVGHVHLCIAHKHLDTTALEGGKVEAVAKVVKENFDKAEAQYKKAFDFRENSFDVLVALGQLEFERAKVAAKFVVKPLPPSEAVAPGDEEAAKKQQAASAAESSRLLKEALAALTPGDIKSAKGAVQKAEGWFTKARAAAQAADVKKEEEAKKKKEQQQAEEEKQQQQQQAPKEPEPTFLSQADILRGNMLYEWSQMLAAVGSEWRPVLDEAVELFRGAACKEEDIRNALKNHSQVEQLDLGPDPEPAAPEPSTSSSSSSATAAKPSPQEAKGLPSLEVKKKPATAAAASTSS